MPKSETKKDRAYQVFKKAIIAGQLKSAKIYSITELSETFEVGRTPAREALVILASEGLIDPIPRSGYQVTSPSIQDILEMFHLRSVLEVEGVRLAAGRITEDDIYLLEENNRLEQELAMSPQTDKSALSYRKGYELNLEFHLTIARASGNNRLVDLVEKLLNELKKTFRPEFLNRIDGVVVFHSLSKEHVRKIVDLMLDMVAKQLAEKRITLEVTDAAKDFLGTKGYDEVFGARPLRRVIQDMVEDKLSEDLLRGKFREGDKVVVDLEEEEIVVHPAVVGALLGDDKP